MIKHITLLLLISLLSCRGQHKNSNMPNKPVNSLIHETSPYLLQHANNPVNWNPWKEEVLKKAQKENKLILISIGYAACHWCHVMEHESFENEEVASVMNENFINIKVDREERPDIDQVYMTAVQMMTGQGGWPLNCIALPDGRPIWGGTYFRKNDWLSSLQQLANLYKENPQKIIKYADELAQGIKQVDLVKPNTSPQSFSLNYLEKSVEKWSIYFDEEFGGVNRAPKFPMPTNYSFLLRYAYQTKNEELLSYVNTTLTKMALGGIFDQVGGGFARYSVDTKWHIPHFEKMLYDNGQLVSLYSDAYLATNNELYKETVLRTLEFVERELLDSSGGFYSSLDADSLNEKEELEEGAFYVWTKEELKECLQEDYSLFEDYYNINSFGFWEEGKYHLIRKITDDEFTKKHKITDKELKGKVEKWYRALLKKRSEKPRPRLDDKILTSWNALLLKGYCKAYNAFKNPHYLKMAIKNATFIEHFLHKRDGGLYRNFKKGTATINAFLEDYATVINAYINLYQVTFDERWLTNAKQLTDYCFDYFFDEKSGFFFFTSSKDAKLISRKIETEDNVIPASNSIMAKNLFLLSHYYDNPYYMKVSSQMLHTVANNKSQNYPSAYSNWLDLYLNHVDSYFELAISGNNALEKLTKVTAEYIPNKLIAGATVNSSLPILKNRYTKDKTLLYVCVDKTCKRPVEKSEEAIKQLKNN